MLEPSTQEFYIVTRPIQPPRTRTRTSSLLSISSGVSLGAIFEIAKAQSTSGLSHQPDTHQAHGAFIPVRPAMATLKNFAHFVSPPPSRTSKRRRRVTFSDKCSYSPTWTDEEPDASSSSSQMPIPHITRTTASSSFDTPSPSSSVSSLSGTPHYVSSNDLHPILAQLERTSRLCAQVSQCTTCSKKGNDFPRCPKCGDMWCSRPCRLVGGKRHVCSVTSR